MDGNYLATTDKAEKAVDVYLEEVEGGYRVYFLVEGVKNYIDCNEYKAGSFGIRITDSDNAKAVWTINQFGALETLCGETPKALGCYKTYTTISLSNSSYTTADNVDVSQFPARLSTVSIVEIYAKQVETPVKETPYKYAVAQNIVGKTVYFAGAMDGNYLATTDNKDKAVDVYLEEVEGGYRVYFLVEGVKNYIDCNEYKAGSFGIRITDSDNAKAVWTINQFGALETLCGETPKALGCYKTYTTISLSNSSYTTADNVDVSQFPARLSTIEFVK